MRYLLLLLLSLVATAQAQDWEKLRLTVTPGQSVGSVTLGQPVPEATLKFLGLTAEEIPATQGQDGSGVIMWGEQGSQSYQRGLLVHLGRDADPKLVESIRVRAIRASTERGVYLGAPAILIRQKYPEAQQDGSDWRIPGLIFTVEKGKVAEMQVLPLERESWRFAPLTASPGRGCGPLELGKPLSPEALELLGPPTARQNAGGTPSSGFARWAGGEGRLIEVRLHDGRRATNIGSVLLRKVNVMTDRKLRLGDSLDEVKRTYPEGRLGVSTESGIEHWKLPGMKLILRRGQLEAIELFSTTNNL
ncbi:MAG: hypothetical protein AB7S38_02525 [Vulcanimicrobiota bacterium]